MYFFSFLSFLSGTVYHTFPYKSKYLFYICTIKNIVLVKSLYKSIIRINYRKHPAGMPLGVENYAGIRKERGNHALYRQNLATTIWSSFSHHTINMAWCFFFSSHPAPTFKKTGEQIFWYILLHPLLWYCQSVHDVSVYSLSPCRSSIPYFCGWFHIQHSLWHFTSYSIHFHVKIKINPVTIIINRTINNNNFKISFTILILQMDFDIFFIGCSE